MRTNHEFNEVQLLIVSSHACFLPHHAVKMQWFFPPLFRGGWLRV